MDADFPTNLLPCIAKFFTTEWSRIPGKDFYQDVFDADVFFPLQRQQELAAMMRIARSINPTTVYEIGSDKGGGLYHWCKCLPTVERVIACEIRGTPYRHLFEHNFPHIEFKWIEGNSYDPDVIRYVSEWAPIDCLFIDGDKGEFERDFNSYLPHMNSHGIVFMHDIRDYPPVEAYNKISKLYKHEEIINIEDTIAAMDKSHPMTAHETWLWNWSGSSCGVGVIYLGE